MRKDRGRAATRGDRQRRRLPAGHAAGGLQLVWGRADGAIRYRAAPGDRALCQRLADGDDFGVVAVSDHGTPLGAAWARAFPVDNPGYGFVAPNIPELTLAVAAAQRGRGVGRRLLEALIEVGRERGWREMSLTVEDGNRAAALYRAAGFRVVGRHGSSDTMLVEICA